jgi:DNA modification methylase
VKELEPLHDPSTRFFVGDCREVMGVLDHQIRDDFPLQSQSSIGADLIIADPPFNNGTDYDGVWNDRMPDEEYRDFTEDWIVGAAGLLCDTGSLWVNIPDEHAVLVNILAAEAGLKRINWCIWHYRFGQHLKSRFSVSKVHSLWFAKSADYQFFRDAVLVESVRQQMGDIRADDAGCTPLDVWGFEKYWGRVQGNSAERRPQHPNQLPETYVERMIKACTVAGDLVVDPFNGSGTTTTVARALGRRSIGIDVNPRSAASARIRTVEGAVRVPGG